MKAMGQKTAVHWTPREANREADALANGNSSGFDPAKERKFDLAHMGWRILSGRERCEKAWCFQTGPRNSAADDWKSASR